MYCYNFFVSNNKDEKAQCKYACICVCALAGVAQHIWNCSWRPHVCNNISLLAFSGLPASLPAFLRVCVYVCVCVFGLQAEFVIFFCNIFFCVCRLTIWLGGLAASVVGCAFG